MGDGWADENDGGKRMLLKVRSYDFAKEFADRAARLLGKKDSYWVRRVTDKHGKWFLVKVTSFMLYNFLNGGFDKLRSVVEPFPKQFLRGFYTAEGCPSISLQKRYGPVLSAGVVVSNSDRALLQCTYDLLTRQGYHPGKIRLNFQEGKKTNLGSARRPGWLLTISRFAEVQRFGPEIGFADASKQHKLDEAVRLIRESGPRGAAAKWVELYEKRRGDWSRR